MPSLDDDAIDFPQAYKAIAILIRSLSLSDDAVTALLEKVDVYGEPKVTPKMKLDKALAAVDEGI
jgi:translation initiation factor 4G